MSPKFFISYRRVDSAYAARSLHRHLTDRFGTDSTFFDIGSIPLGADFAGFIKEQVAACDVFLPVIGDYWTDLRFEDGELAGSRRLDDADDLVRREIEAALSADVTIIPVLVGYTNMPTVDDLPTSIQPLAGLNAAEVRPTQDFDQQLARLLERLEELTADDEPMTNLADLSSPDPIDLDSFPERPPSICVGREDELHFLSETLDAVIGGEGRVVYVSGQTGTGKTTLMRHFLGLAEAASDSILMVAGSCNEHTGRQDAYRPIRDILLQFCGETTGTLNQGEIGRVAAARLQTASTEAVRLIVEGAPDLVSAFVPLRPILAAASEAGQVDWVAKVRHLADAAQNLSPTREIQREALYRSVLSTLRGLAMRRPLLLIVDDLQWADSATIDLLKYLQDECQYLPIMILASYRPDDLVPFEKDQKHPLVGAISAAKRTHGRVVLDLDALDKRRLTHFVDALIDLEPNDLDEDFRSAFLEHTDGNALFAVGLLASLKESGALVRSASGRWELAASVDWTDVPPRIEGLIEERIERIDAGARQLLSTASIEGDVFTATVLARLEDLDERAVITTLSRDLVKRHQILTESDPVRVGTRWLSQFAFIHRMMHQQLYLDRTKAERRMGHYDVARVLQELYEDDLDRIAHELAFHFERAGDIEMAVGYLVRAAQQNLSICAYDEALSLADRALALMADAEDLQRIELGACMVRAAVLKATFGWLAPETVAAYDRAYELCEALGDEPRTLSAVIFSRWVASLLRLDLDAALEQAEFCVALGEQVDDIDIRIQSHVAVGNTLFWKGELDGAHEHVARVMELFPEEHAADHLRLHGQDSRVFALMFLCLIASFRGDETSSLRYQRDLEALVAELDHPFSSAIAEQAFAWNCVHLGDVDGTRVHSQRLIDLCVEEGFPFYHAVGLIFGGWAEATCGDPGPAIEQMRDAFENRISVGGCIVFHSLYARLLTQALDADGRTDEALAMAERGIEVAQQHGELLYEPALQELRTTLKRR